MIGNTKNSVLTVTWKVWIVSKSDIIRTQTQSLHDYLQIRIKFVLGMKTDSTPCMKHFHESFGSLNQDQVRQVDVHFLQ